MFIFKKKPQNVVGVIFDGFDLYKFTFSRIWIIGFIISLVSEMPAFLGWPGSLYQRIDVNKSIHLSDFAILLFFIVLLLSGYFLSLLIHRLYVLVTTPEVGIAASFKIATKKIIWIYIGSLIYAFLCAFSLLLFIIPGVFVAILLSMYLPLILFDNTTGWGGIVESAKMVWGHWWRTFAVLLLPMIIILVVRFFAGLIPFWSPYMTNIIDVIVLTFMIPLMYAILLVQFFDLKLRLSLRVTATEVQTPKSIQSP